MLVEGEDVVLFLSQMPPDHPPREVSVQEEAHLAPTPRSSEPQQMGMPIRSLIASNRESRLCDGRKLIGSVFTSGEFYHDVNIVDNLYSDDSCAEQRAGSGRSAGGQRAADF